jgi:hypothetical protein
MGLEVGVAEVVIPPPCPVAQEVLILTRAAGLGVGQAVRAVRVISGQLEIREIRVTLGRPLVAFHKLFPEGMEGMGVPGELETREGEGVEEVLRGAVPAAQEGVGLVLVIPVIPVLPVFPSGLGAMAGTAVLPAGCCALLVSGEGPELLEGVVVVQSAGAEAGAVRPPTPPLLLVVVVVVVAGPPVVRLRAIPVTREAQLTPQL